MTGAPGKTGAPGLGRLIGGLLLRLALALGPGLATFWALQGQGSVEPALWWGLTVLAVFGVWRHRPPRRPGLQLLLGLVTGTLWLAAFGLLWALLTLTPNRQLLDWTALLGYGEQRGVIGTLFALVSVLVGTALAAVSWSRSLKIISLFSALLHAGGAAGLLFLSRAPGAVLPGAILAGFSGLTGLALLVWAGRRRARPGRLGLGGVTLALVAGLPLLVAAPAALSPGRAQEGKPLIPAGFDQLARLWLPQAGQNLPTDATGFTGNPGQNDPEPSLIALPLVRVETAPSPSLRLIYLRGQIFDHFGGQTWGRRVPYASFEQPARRLAQERQPELRLEVLGDLLPFIPHTLEARSVAVTPRRDDKRLLAGFRAGGYLLDYPLVTGDVIWLSRQGDRPPPDLEPAYYRQLMPLEPTLEAYFQALTAEIPRSGLEAERLEALQNRLSESLTYAYENPQGPQTTVLGRFLLGSRRGYAPHFATVFVLGARRLGFEARFVQGFVVPFAPGADRAQASTLNSHAWAEVRRADGSWITWEASPPFRPEGLAQAESLLGAESSRGATRAQLGTVLADLLPGQTAQSGPSQPTWLYTGLGVLVVLGLFGWGLGQPGETRRAKPTPEAPLPPWLGRLLRLGRRHGFPDPRAEGWQAWTANTRYWGTALPARLERLLWPHLFGRRPLTARDQAYLRALTHRLTKNPSQL